MQWTVYDTGTKRIRYSSGLISTITAETVVVDGFARSPKDTAGFLHGNSEKQFAYGYLSGSNLLQTLTMPNNMTLTQSYESQRDLLTGMSYKRGNTPVAERSYSYDTLGRPLTRSTTRSGQATRSDSFSHNERSELSAATLGSDSYSYAYDNIGNRTTATEVGVITAYASNNLNQYTSVGEFTPTFDADGNQTLVKTTTGIWAVQYNAENRPVSFTNSASNTVVECTYDSMGRRTTKKVTTNGSVTSYLRFIYRGYLQIAAIDAISGTFQWFLVWDPTQSIATRPLAIRKDGTWYAYGWDLTKNICEVYGQHGYIRSAYTYTPYGEVSASGDVEQPVQWSSEYTDTELSLVYYNYRHYNPKYGNWASRDFYTERQKCTLYSYVKNMPILKRDYFGLAPGIGDEDFDFDAATCALKLTLHVSFNFVTTATYNWRGEGGESGKYPYTGSEWTEGRKIKYKSNFLNDINQMWNAGYKAKLVDRAGKSCCQCAGDCKEGIEFTIEAVEDTLYTATEIHVTAPSYAEEPEPGHSFDEYRSQGGGRHILMAEGTENAYRVVNHELGHIFGLHHPGYGIDGIAKNTTKEYAYRGLDTLKREVDGNVDLMGKGIGLRGFYFNIWLNYLNNNSLNYCAKKNNCSYKIDQN